MLKRKIKAYFSHPIQGYMGNKCPPEQIQFNCTKAVEWSKKLWEFFGSNLELYVPGAHDEWAIIAMEKGYLTVDQVLDIDCEIVSCQDVLLAANWEGCPSGGMTREIDAAVRLGIPHRVFTNVQEGDLRALEIWLENTFNGNV